MTRASLDKRPAEVQAMFDAVAQRYDLTNDVLSLGQDRRWRTAVLRAVDPRPGDKVLDLAAGTGTSFGAFAERGALVVPCDFSVGMLRVGKRADPRCPSPRATPPGCPSPTTASTPRPSASGSATSSNPDAGLREIRRVVRPGGRLWSASSPARPGRRSARLPRVPHEGAAPDRPPVSSSPDAYVYLAESIRAWPDQPALAARIAAAGWSSPEWQNLSGGIVALHRATA